MTDLKIYLTSLQPDMDQTIFSQSIGGYISNSLLYPESTVDGTIGLYDTSFVLDSLNSGTWADWKNAEYLNINNEVMKVSPITGRTISVIQRGFNNIIETHISGDLAKGISTNELFNDVFNDSYKQYRCLAVKNVSIREDPSITQSVNNVSVYIKQNSRNQNSILKIAIEKPVNQYLESSASSITSNLNNSTSILTDISLAGYGDNYFKDSYLKITGGTNKGQGRVIISFESSTGEFILDGILTDDTVVSYEILTSPAQRVKSGMISPDTIDSNITSFSLSDEFSPIDINFSNETEVSLTSNLLNFNDVFYIWLERTVKKGFSSFDDNDVIINIKYTI